MSKPVDQDTHVLWVVDMGLRPYGPMWDIQKALVLARGKGRIPDVLLLTEHEPVFTMGRRGGWKHLHVPRSFLDARGIPCIETDRGGDVTYHGPGQLVGYPVLRVPGGGRRVRSYVESLERVIILVLARFGISAERRPEQPGIWTGGAKIASIGLAVKHEVCFHGFALNVAPDLSPFSWIDPCGMKEARITSMQALLGESPSLTQIREELVDAFCSVMGCRPLEVSGEDLGKMLKRRAARYSRFPCRRRRGSMQPESR